MMGHNLVYIYVLLEVPFSLEMSIFLSFTCHNWIWGFTFLCKFCFVIDIFIV
jgi:hypothetical protein